MESELLRWLFRLARLTIPTSATENRAKLDGSGTGVASNVTLDVSASNENVTGAVPEVPPIEFVAVPEKAK